MNKEVVIDKEQTKPAVPYEIIGGHVASSYEGLICLLTDLLITVF